LHHFPSPDEVRSACNVTRRFIINIVRDEQVQGREAEEGGSSDWWERGGASKREDSSATERKNLRQTKPGQMGMAEGDKNMETYRKRGKEQESWDRRERARVKGRKEMPVKRWDHRDNCDKLAWTKAKERDTFCERG